ncbi:FAD:protein FMN transferase [Dyadobacter pollutisoli]|uniref:FAD:protein FMN transferase n=1 Tax=Dyadobacter pollutisoli TaxID=2910158 RepID=A0A9E8SM84_9BACT|nr:FAD:protein FMN transferase [Dyadobacter pollutisoli]WAC09512.1 FAD:protein FMN transferase [Dyadobacter pollutisoli]
MNRFAGVVCFLMSWTLPLSDEAATLETPMVSISGEAQGTTYHIKYFDGQNRNFKVQIDSILTEFDKSLSNYRKDSEIAEFNKSSSLTFRLPYFYPVLKKSEEIFNATDGAFDPTIMPLVEAYGFGPKKKIDPENANVDSLLQLIGFQNIQFNKTSVSKKKPHIRLDFNGIAQGYSVDIIGHFLETKNINRFMVEIGGEVVCKGKKNDGQYWVAGIENPLVPGTLHSSIVLADRAMTTAGNYRNHFKKNGQVFNHIINPKTGSMEQSSVLSVTVIAKDAITADGYDTAFFVMGLDGIKRFLTKRKDIDVYVLYTNDEGKMEAFVTEGIKNFIKETAN